MKFDIDIVGVHCINVLLQLVAAKTIKEIKVCSLLAIISQEMGKRATIMEIWHVAVSIISLGDVCSIAHRHVI